VGAQRGGARDHVVLVPGFVGFDALGQLDYYAGVTQVFDRWAQGSGREGRRASIHYFDNFPTASVQHRAKRLREYLAARVARGEFSPGDRLALVGHSTGGLDIRRALRDMALRRDAVIVRDGCCEVRHAQILELTERIAFLSVPHFGTNLADWAARFDETLTALARDAVLGLKLNAGAIGKARRRLFAVFARSRSDVVRAVLDALDESEDVDGPQEVRTAAREARYELIAWLENIANDFSVISDLRSASGLTPGASPASPAHFGADERREEIRALRALRIKTRSYVTRVPPGSVRPSRFAERLVDVVDRAGPLIDLGNRLLRSNPAWRLIPAAAVLSDAARAAELVALPLTLQLLGSTPSLLFDVFHAACANPRGPFRRPADIAPSIRDPRSGAEIRADDISVGDNDGVVNTLSMLWPYDPDDPSAHRFDLVEADHGDVIGHYRLRPLEESSPSSWRAHDGSLRSRGRIPRRRYFAYDFFQTKFHFSKESFDSLWTSVFDFCAGEERRADASQTAGADPVMEAGQP